MNKKRAKRNEKNTRYELSQDGLRIERNLKNSVVGDLIQIGLLHIVVVKRAIASAINMCELTATGGLVENKQRRAFDIGLVRVDKVLDLRVHVCRHAEEHAKDANVHDADERAVVGAALEQAPLEDIGGAASHAVNALASVDARVCYGAAQPTCHVWACRASARRLHGVGEHR